jgi:hypothetical protein
MQQPLPQNMECDGIERAAGIALGSLLPVKSGEPYNLTFLLSNNS